MTHNFDDAELTAVLTSSIHHYDPGCDGDTLVRQAMAAPVGSPALAELAKGKQNVVVIASDHTRPVPSKIIMPHILAQIRQGNPDANITILIATGCHRGTTLQELTDKFGPEIVANESIYIHDCDEQDKLVHIGTLPSGGPCQISRLAVEADLLVSEGFIEPHFFAGFSGGRKSVLPGVAGRSTVLSNHCSEFIAHPCTRTGVLENNPIHEDMLWAAKTAGLSYIVNVVLNEDKKVIFATAGNPEQAHKKGSGVRNVVVWDSGSFTMSGGELKAGTCGSLGGNLRADKGAHITIIGGKISGATNSDISLELVAAKDGAVNPKNAPDLTIRDASVDSVHIADNNEDYDPVITFEGKAVIGKVIRGGTTKPVIAFNLTEGANVCISGDKVDEVFGTGSSTLGISSDNGMFAVLDGSNLKWSDGILGDFTEDGLVTDADVIYLLWYTVFPEDYPLNGKADFTGDGLITDADVIYLLWYTVFPGDYPLK